MMIHVKMIIQKLQVRFHYKCSCHVYFIIMWFQLTLLDQDNILEGVYEIHSDGQVSVAEPSSPSSSGASSQRSFTPTVTIPKIASRKKKQKCNDDVNSVIIDAVKKATDEEKSELPHDIEAFSHFLGHELLRIRNKTKFMWCKWAILDIIRNYIV